MIWRFAGDFVKVSMQFEMAAIKSEIIHILQSPPYGNVQFILLNLKWPPQIIFFNICDRKNSNLIYGGG